MQCDVIQKDLVGFHFGTLTIAQRRPIEAHLCECTHCLRAYLSLKNHFEVEEEEDVPPPSREMKAKLFAEVSALFPNPQPQSASPRGWPIRFIPYGSALAATAVVLFILIATAHRHLPTTGMSRQPVMPSAAEVRGSVDSARQGVENVNFL